MYFFVEYQELLSQHKKEKFKFSCQAFSIDKEFVYYVIDYIVIRFRGSFNIYWNN